MISTTLYYLNKIILGSKEELLAVSNLFNNKVKRSVRSKLPYKTNYYIHIK